jgi:hypothetical protein
MHGPQMGLRRSDHSFVKRLVERWRRAEPSVAADAPLEAGAGP